MFSKYFRKILKYQIPRKSFQWEPSRSMTEKQTDGRTDGWTARHDGANSCFTQFC